MNDYSFLKQTAAHKQWELIGIQRRAGITTPLFSVYSHSSIGIGEIPDLKILIDWCEQTSLSLLQLLPLNEVGLDFSPYNSQSSFALEPMYLSLTQLRGVTSWHYFFKLRQLRKSYPTGSSQVDYQIKEAKLKLLWEIFQDQKPSFPLSFTEYLNANRYWLDDFALFKVLKEQYQQQNWEWWPDPFKNRDPEALAIFKKENSTSLLFHQWLQWQLFEQLEEVSEYAKSKNVCLCGDLPLLVSRDSADVWTYQKYFNLDCVAGAPPDLYFAKGQRWGMPTYNWKEIEQENYQYLTQKLKYAEQFFQLFRIDHSVGLFRIWSIDQSEPMRNHGMNGVFDPENESLWEAHGRKILSVILNNTTMLPYAEDLGTVPNCSFKVLKELGIPGTDVQRWMKNWKKDYLFLSPEKFRPISVTTVSTHDMSPFAAWWEFEANTVEEHLFKRICDLKEVSFTHCKSLLFELSKYNRLHWKPEITKEKLLQILGLKEEEAFEFIDLYLGSFKEKEHFLNYLGLSDDSATDLSLLTYQALLKASQSASIFILQLLQDLLTLTGDETYKTWTSRINFPGTIGFHNWTYVYPLPLEKLKKLKINSMISDINKSTKRRYNRDQNEK